MTKSLTFPTFDVEAGQCVSLSTNISETYLRVCVWMREAYSVITPRSWRDECAKATLGRISLRLGRFMICDGRGSSQKFSLAGGSGYAANNGSWESGDEYYTRNHDAVVSAQTI